MFKKIALGFFAIILTIAFSTVSSEASQPLFGPKEYSRTTGKPDTYSDKVSVCNTAATYKLVIENGDGSKNKISAGSITLNSVEVVKESEFSQKVDRIEKAVTLNGDNTMDVKLASGPGGYIKVSIYCTANCLDININAPSNNSTIDRAKTLIAGSLSNTYGETGVKIKSAGTDGEVAVLAQIKDTGFAGIVPLQKGANTITATATDACGYQAENSITVNTSKLEEPVSLSVIPSSGVPLSSTGILAVSLEADTRISNPVANYSWDLNGDGTPEKEGKDLSKVDADYTYTGLYFPRVTITDTAGNTYTETAIVNVLSKDEMDTLLKGKWEGMKGGLSSADIDKAVGYFTEGSTERYKGIFTALKDNLSAIASDMQQIQMIYMKDGVAKYRIRRNESVGEVTYYIYFQTDQNGIWKIRQF